MFARRNILFAEGGAGRDRTVEGGVQHAAASFGFGLPAAGARGFQATASTRLGVAAHGFDVNSLTRRGTKTRERQNASIPWT